jgi:ABC-2 type transport system permease protein
MSKFFRVTLYEYKRHVLQKRFIFALLSVPLFIGLIVLMVIFLVYLETDTTPVGYVDASGLLANRVPGPEPEDPDRPIQMLAFSGPEEAEAALKAEEIQAYFVLPEDYLQSGEARLVYIEQPNDPVYDQFYAFLSANLLQDQLPAVRERVLEGNEIIVRAPQADRQASEKDWFNIFIPLFAGIVFFMAISTTSGYLLQAVVEEKENRTMEVVVTSVSPGQFMAGKITGDIAIGLTQLIAWALFIWLALVVGRTRFDWMQNIHIEPEMVSLAVLMMLPAFVMISALMAAVGATVTEAREGQQVTGIFTMIMWAPYFLMITLMEYPNSPLSVALSLFPLTAPLAMLMRAGFTVIPTWQVVVSVSLLVASAVGALWLAGRAFRLGMLRYGQRLRWKEVFSR